MGNPRHVACVCFGETLASSPRGSQCSFSNVQKDIKNSVCLINEKKNLKYIKPDFGERHRQLDLLRPTVFFCQNLQMSKVVIIKVKSATTAFFFFSSFPSPRSFFSSFLFLRYHDFGASLAYETCLLTPFHSNDRKFR